MMRLPADIIALLAHFAPLFSRRTWRYVPTLVAGVLLAPGRRMVSSALRAVVVAGDGEDRPEVIPVWRIVLARQRDFERGC